MSTRFNLIISTSAKNESLIFSICIYQKNGAMPRYLVKRRHEMKQYQKLMIMEIEIALACIHPANAQKGIGSLTGMSQELEKPAIIIMTDILVNMKPISVSIQRDLNTSVHSCM